MVFILETLVEKAKNGDRKSLMVIIEKYKFLIIKLASTYHIPSYEFEDLVQQGYLSVIKAVNLYTLGRNTFDGYCINSIKTNFNALLKGKLKHYREVPNSDPISKSTAEEYKFTLEDEVIAYDEVKRLYCALEKLDPSERAIVERFYLVNDTLKEIACDSSQSYNHLLRVKSKALKKLRKYI
ncbi:sigma-70 family RNA polymerase sigma factor (plasmid) [Clostridium estertheticum]|uniref:sigma-70 family RNA polymerase sigma factor n=1 Tax=Clostridium estertheticum TaxID=238834 RepID=UPI001CF43CB4|nr:sigma-70 family RNA polymerase sigma factor [Clostridium estertheticum]MCB2309171.1 sigma-70 family RNA polymerase sigma factor [Clostridium estertheticum]MCB2347537.1 sigma-70 family RNA polymerase sigma factor [Clostridium estertheticum]WAG48298.1 sigma-70 family RNA polymerase sigma factor [Clostridium estertheticum]